MEKQYVAVEYEKKDDDVDDDLKEVLDNELMYLVKNSQEAEQMRVLLELNRYSPPIIGWETAEAKKELISQVGSATILDKLNKVKYLAHHPLNDKRRYRLNYADYIEKKLNAWFPKGSTLSTEMALKEKQEVVDKLATEYANFLKNVKKEHVKEWTEKIKDIDDLIEYTKHIMDGLYMDALLVFIQQYSMADADILVLNPDTGKMTKRGQTGFSLAYYGDPGTGKTFSTDDLLRGNTRYGIPPHGIIGKLRYAEGMTPKQFIAILEAYQNYPVDWIIPEFRDFFRYPGMVEKLKLVMERREVSDETRTTKIGPYKVTSFFIVNYNLKLTKYGYKDTMSDPNFSAVEDRMICKLFVNTREREEQVFKNMMRISSGDVDFYLADALRKHITYTYHWAMTNKATVILEYGVYKELGEWLLEEKRKYAPYASLRMLERAVQIAASAALVKALATENADIFVTDKEIALAKEFIRQELASRALKS